DTNALRPQRGRLAVESREGSGGYVGLREACDAALQVDYRHAALGVGGVGGVGLALVGREHVAAVGRHRNHVGHGPHRHLLQENPVLVEEHHAAVGLRVGAFNGAGHQPVAHIHRVDAAVAADVDGRHRRNGAGVGQAQNVELAAHRVGHVQALSAGIKSRDFGRVNLISAAKGRGRLVALEQAERQVAGPRRGGRIIV
nr:hypothetical protein [Tanacetum cinerariifolium]